MTSGRSGMRGYSLCPAACCAHTYSLTSSHSLTPSFGRISEFASRRADPSERSVGRNRSSAVQIALQIDSRTQYSEQWSSFGNIAFRLSRARASPWRSRSVPPRARARVAPSRPSSLCFSSRPSLRVCHARSSARSFTVSSKFAQEKERRTGACSLFGGATEPRPTPFTMFASTPLSD